MNKRLCDVLENLLSADISKITLTRCGSGDVNSSFIAECGGKKRFLKLSNNDNLPSLYEKQIEREYIGTTLAEGNGISCPKILAYEPQDGFLVTEFVNLTLLSEVWSGLDYFRRIDVKQQALALVGKMSEISSNVFGALYDGGKIKQCKSWHKSFINLVQTALWDCVSYKSLTDSESDFIMEKAEKINERLADCKPAKAVFTHLDFHWSNVFIDLSSMTLAQLFDFGSSLFVPDYMAYYRLGGGFLYGTEDFYKDIACPYVTENAERDCAALLNTLDYFTFLSYKGKPYDNEKHALLGA